MANVRLGKVKISSMGSYDFDVLAASLRRDTGDMRAYLNALASKLGDAFPQRVRIKRRRGLFGRRGEVERILLRLGNGQYELRIEDGEPVGFRRSVVRGITLKSDELSLEAWIDDVIRALVTAAERSERDRQSVEKLLRL